MDKTDRLRDYGLAFLLYEQGLGICGYELIRELFIFIKLILNSYLLFYLFTFLPLSVHHMGKCSLCRHFGLLCHTLTEVSCREGGIALRNHPSCQVWNQIQTLQSHDACCHQIPCREERVLQVCRHRLLRCGDSRQVLHLYAEHDIEEQ